MSRAVKFRVWDDESKRMSCIEITNNNCGCGWLQSPHIHFMQFTGLLDKNGNEIYEGDIIKFAPFDIDRFYKVVWNDHKACWFVISGGYTDRLNLFKEGVVVGNIYEHPHLLEAQ